MQTLGKPQAVSEESNISSLYSKYVNGEWVRLLELLGMNKRFVECRGAKITSSDGISYLDYLAGYGVYNVGHNHPSVIAQLIVQLQSGRPSMLQTHVPELAALLAERLCRLAGGKIEKAFFTNTGSEGIETVIKFARHFTRREGVLFAAGGFHGLTCGALSLMSNGWWREHFGALLPNCDAISFGDLTKLEEFLRTKKYAAFVLEPIQGEAGIALPAKDYFKNVQKLCEKYGTLLVLDEVQTGIYRTGTFLAAHQLDVEPDMVVLAKAMSGGHVPVGALLMRKDINESVYSSTERSFIHASTFGENALSMRACIATLDVIDQENLGERCIVQGERLRRGIREVISRHHVLKEVRGLGLFNGIEFQPPQGIIHRLRYEAFRKLHPGLFGQMLVRQLFHSSNILTQMCGNNYMVIKAVPPLVISDQEIDAFIEAIDNLADAIERNKNGFWSQGLAIGKKALLGR